jgi:hypothetical protein
VGVAAIKIGDLSDLEKTVGARFNLFEFYTTFRDPLDSSRLRAIIRQGTLPLIQMSPTGVTLAAIAAGNYDSYLKRYASGIKGLKHQVAISFAPEANGNWYPWACGQSPAAAYIAAWRHIHDVMALASNIIWVWDVNSNFHGSCPLAARWPGGSYVTWTAVDGYWQNPGDTFANVLEPTIRQLSKITNKPVLIAETGAPDVSGANEWISTVFAGAEDTPGVIGIVWFNHTGKDGDNRLQDDPPALNEFRRLSRAYIG